MNYVLVFRPEVREELGGGYSWYESQKPGLGDEFLNCVDEAVNPDFSRHLEKPTKNLTP